MSLLLVGERINASGSRHARRLLLEGDQDGVIALAREQLRDGAHALDVCVAMADRTDELPRMLSVTQLLVQHVTAPLFIDSADPAVVAAAVPLVGGRGVANSVTLRAGRADIDRIAPIVRRHHAGLVALCIDERGLATTREAKIEVAERLYALIVGEHGVPATSLYIDALTRPPQGAAGAGARDALAANDETLAALPDISQRLPGVRTILGISDASYGMPPDVRADVNRQLLRRAVDAGLDAAIADVRQLAGAR